MVTIPHIVSQYLVTPFCVPQNLELHIYAKTEIQLMIDHLLLQNL